MYKKSHYFQRARKCIINQFQNYITVQENEGKMEKTKRKIEKTKHFPFTADISTILQIFSYF